MKTILNLSFLPQSTDLGLLLLRLCLGMTMLFNHGWSKVQNFQSVAPKFFPVIIDSQVSLGLAVFAEVICAGLLIIGIFTRFCSLMLVITMAVAFFMFHHMDFSDKSAELAFLYLVGFSTLTLAGAGKYSADRV